MKPTSRIHTSLRSFLEAPPRPRPASHGALATCRGAAASLAAAALLPGLLAAQSATPVEGHDELLPAQPFRATWEPPLERVGPVDARAEALGAPRSGASQAAPGRPAPWAPTRFAEHVPVALWNGAVQLEEVDLFVESRGMPFVFSRTYSSRADFDGDLGHNWTHPFARRVVALPDGSVARIDGLGREDVFGAPAPGSGAYVAPRGVFATLERSGRGQMVETLPGGLRFFYSTRPSPEVTGVGMVGYPDALQATWHLTRIVDRAGNEMSVVRSSDNRIREIVDTLGRAYVFAYDGGRIVSIADFSGREVVYEYDAAGDLVARRSPVVVGTPNGNDFPAGKTERYSYSSGHADARLDHNLLTVTEPMYLDVAEAAVIKPALSLTYSSESGVGALDFDRVIAVRWGHDQGGPPSMPAMMVGGTVRLAYANDLTGDSSAPAGAVRRTTELSPAGDQRRHYFDAQGQEVRLVELTNRDVRPGEGDLVTDWTYDAEGLIVARDLPRGNRVEFTYDTLNPSRGARGDLLEVRRMAGSTGTEPDLVTRYTYEPVFHVLRTSTDGRAFPTGAVPLDNTGALDLAAPDVARYTTTRIFDYQEGTGFQDAAGVPAPLQIPEGLGDRNGAPDFDAGNVVEVVFPTIQTSGPNQGDASASQRAWNEAGQLLSTVDPTGFVMGFAYFPSNGIAGDATDREGYLASITEDAGGAAPIVTSYERDTRGNLTARIDPMSRRTDRVVNELDQVVREESPVVVDATRYTAEWTYDLNDDLVRFERSNLDADGAPYDHAVIATRFEYDILHHPVVRELDASANDDPSTVWVRYETRFNAEGEPAAWISPAPTLGTHAAPTRTTAVYDERGLLYKLVRGDDDDDPSNAPPRRSARRDAELRRQPQSHGAPGLAPAIVGLGLARPYDSVPGLGSG